MENEGGKKRPSKTLVVTGILGWLLVIWEFLYFLTRIPILIILGTGAAFFALEKVLDVVLGRIFRRKPKQ
ncbi:hypothetical protein [Pseudovibrio sp. WM33]|uniref:hypothetical protein n=1 Tax=Pseudovibrio sp. WM33 TaxID=1735585 RepID=UPI0007AE9BA6|nr:hypothetical protein [Pseudovibrio sp. WM33]KZL27408.1 hypothetical protein PsWM33_00917 [Pseudovibrio sp. WM33]